MNEVPSSLYFNQKLGFESIATAMFSSASLEDLLTFFLTTLGTHLAVDRVAIFKFINQQQGKILVEAISPNLQSIKNQTYSIAYFGIDSLSNCPCDRAVILLDIAQTTKNSAIYEDWQRTQIKAMMSAPILFDSSTSVNKIWGLAVVQQCDQPRLWEPSEAEFLFRIAQILGQCLKSWKLRLRSTAFQEEIKAEIMSEREEFLAHRIELPENVEIISEEMTVSSNFILPDDDHNEILDRIHVGDNETSINFAINLALQKLDWKTQHSSSNYPITFAPINHPQNIDGVDVESITLENVLEASSQDKTLDKADYLQQKVNELIESLQHKIDEISLLQGQIQELTQSQNELRQMLADLTP
jgi:hypothetical protein